MTGRKEEQFWHTLQNLFVGVPVEGESGYINLMRLKTQYFQHAMRPVLEQFVNEQLREFPDFRKELFDKLYTFLKRYISEETGSIGFFFTPYHQSVYEQVYTDTQDVILFWKTQRLYYVKTDRLFRSMETEVDGFKFCFDASTLEHKKANEKRELVFEFKQIRPTDGAFVFTMQYSERGRQTNLSEVRRALRDSLGLSRFTDAVPSEETLERAFRVFERQSEVDYFLCKDAKSFLREQFDLWLWQYLLGKPGEEPQTEWSETRLRQLQLLKRVAYRVIDYIAAFEDELVRIWNKPKFVLNSNYVITLDRIVEREGGWEVLEAILEHPNLEQQIQEWRELGMVDEDFTPSQIVARENLIDGKQLNPRYQYLPIDTRYFKDLELRILGLFDHLDDALDGWLIKSENYQALNTILPKWRGRVQCIYIDPPYNTGPSEIDYINRYKNSSWLCLIENRLSVGMQFLVTYGIVCMTIDHVELHNAIHMVENLYGESSVLGLVVIKNNPSGRSTVKGFSIANEYAIFIGKSESSAIGMLPRTEKQMEQYDQVDERGRFQWRNFIRSGGANDFRIARPRLYYPLIVSGNSVRIPEMEWDQNSSSWILKEDPRTDEQVVYPKVRGSEYTWRLGIDSLRDRLSDIRVRRTNQGELVLEIKFRDDDEGVLPKTVWDEKLYNATAYGTSLLRDIMGKEQTFSFPKSVYAVSDCIRVCTSEKEAFILDFFAGSGTTAHAVMNLNRQDGGRRRYILIEMADYFYSVLLPRVKKVAFSDKWREGKAVTSPTPALLLTKEEGRGGGFFKYYELEQFEDALRRTRYAEEPLDFEDAPRYLFLRDLKMADALQVEDETVRVALERLDPPAHSSLTNGGAGGGIDLAETLSNLLGKPIQRIEPDPADPTRPAKVIFADGSDADLLKPDWKLIKPLIWW